MHLTTEQINQIGFAYVGSNVLISDKASFYNPGKISIGDHCRLDDFCLISAGEGGILIRSRVHVGCFTSLIGKGKIVIGAFTELSGRVSIYSSTNDFHASSYWKNGDRANIISDDVLIGKNVVIGSGSVVLPGVTVGESSRVGALTLVKTNIPEKEIWGGVPAKKIRDL